MGRTLLLADDSVTIQKVVSLTFASEGVEIITANDGQEAIDKLGDRTPDVALLDVFMPKRDGYEVCSYIKQDERLRNIPVILLVGAFEPFDQEKARSAGADDYLTKPFQSIRQLVTKVNDLLQAKASLAVSPVTEQPLAEVAPAPPADIFAPLDESLVTEHSEAFEIVEATQTEVEEAQFQMDSVLPAEEDLDDSSIEITSIYAPADAFATEASWQSASESEAALAVVEPLVMDDTPLFAEPMTAPVFTMSATTTLFEDNDHLLELEDLVVAAPIAKADDDDVLRIYEEIKLSQPVMPTASAPVFIAETMDEPLPTEAGTTVSATASEPELSSPAAAMELSPATIDAIARRVVELMSDRAVREIAWEVVPELADRHVKQHIAETR